VASIEDSTMPDPIVYGFPHGVGAQNEGFVTENYLKGTRLAFRGDGSFCALVCAASRWACNCISREKP
jgi:hypothetical protein